MPRRLSAARVAAPALAALVVAGGPPAAAAAQPADTLRLAGLHAPVTITRDSSGIAHIRAADEHDLFFAQGWNAARDRLFQLELWRRAATGTMAEALGPRWVARDRAARLFAYRGDMARELAHYHPRGATIVRAFVDGVNARVAQVQADPALLPPELRVLGLAPGRWTPAVVVSRHNALVGNAESEPAMARAVAAIGAERVRQLTRLEPEPVRLALDLGMDVEALSDSVLGAYRAWRAAPAFGREDLAAGAAPADADGSNNWVVAGRRTASGKPLLANDPHRAIAAPSLRYWVHLTAPGWDVVGGGEPALPGVSIGHNRHGAWGLTIFGLDQTDLYVERLDARDPSRVRWHSGWEPMRVVHDTIRVRDAAPVPVTLRYTRHGPVTWVDSARGVAYALRAAWLEPGGAPYLASLRLDQARTWDEFRAAVARNHMPALNYVWADTSGTIGWQVAGIAPVRRTWSGLVPVPGDGRHEWSGFLPIRDLPHAVNPRQGFLGTANENNVPAGYPYPDAVGRGQWAEPWRSRRLHEVLGAARALEARDMAALQHDEVSLPARALVATLRGLAPAALAGDTAVRWARDTLLTWDGTLAARSVPAGVYVAWERTLLRAMTAATVPAPARAAIPTVPLSRLLEWLARPEAAPEGAPRTAAARDALLVATLGAAVRELAGRLGPDRTAWRYGQPGYKHVRIVHPLSALVGGAIAGDSLDHGPLPRGGAPNTLNAAGGTDNQGHGASFRIVVDLADWDATLGTNTPGQSGDPRDPHYRDLFAPWAEGRYFRVPYSAAKVAAAAERIEVLVPGPAGCGAGCGAPATRAP